MSNFAKACAAVAIAAALSLIIVRPERISQVLAACIVSALIGYFTAWLFDLWRNRR